MTGLLAQAAGAGDPILQYGALGLVAIVVIYVTSRLVNWLTGTLNGKLDRLAAATDANTAATRETAEAHRELARQIERLRTQLWKEGR